MCHLAVLFIHFISTLARLLVPAGVPSFVAGSLLRKHRFLILNRSRKRSPKLFASLPAGWRSWRIPLGCSETFGRSQSKRASRIRSFHGRRVNSERATQHTFACATTGKIGALPTNCCRQGHRKVWARLRFAEVRTSKARVPQLVREAQLFAPSHTLLKAEDTLNSVSKNSSAKHKIDFPTIRNSAINHW
jgi:hypothetical protein